MHSFYSSRKNLVRAFVIAGIFSGLAIASPRALGQPGPDPESGSGDKNWIHNGKDDNGKGDDKKESCEGTTYSGEATAVNFQHVHQPSSNPIVLADTGALAATGGMLHSSIGAFDYYNGAVKLQSASASTYGGDNDAVSQASITKFQVELQGSNGHVYVITADSIEATSAAECDKEGGDVDGDVKISGLALDGKPIAVTGKTNQTITFDVWTLTINQQTSTAGSTDGTITVVALRIGMTGCMDGIVCSAHSDIHCTSTDTDKTDHSSDDNHSCDKDHG